MSYQQVNLLSGCLESVAYMPYANVEQFDHFKYVYVDILELSATIKYNGKLLVAVLAEPIKYYVSNNMIYGDNWPSYYIKVFKGNSPDSFRIFVKYNQIIGSRFIGEFPLIELQNMIKDASK